MKIIDFSKNKLGEDILKLFSIIYPDWTIEDVKRMEYEESNQGNICTKIAIIDDNIVGQANVFRLPNNPTIANLGYHIHPDYRRQGIGLKLSKKVMKIAKKSGIKTIIVQTEADNIGAIVLARKLGFEISPKDFVEKNESGLKIHKLKKGICLQKKI
jgi:RimJ/RimL family protein N-acetyltransferase